MSNLFFPPESHIFCKFPPREQRFGFSPETSGGFEMLSVCMNGVFTVMDR